MSEEHTNPFDITLVVKDGKEFQAHRNVLSQASPFFEKLLSTDMKENNEGVIRLEWITESQMADILQFIYTCNVQISSQENAENLIATADYLLLSNLKTIAGKFLQQHMTTENCMSIYYIAEQYSCEELIASARKFINSNFTTVAASYEFLKLPSHEVEKWISSDEIVIDAEENVFEIILRWIDYNKSERSVRFGELFRHVRLTTISRDILLSVVATNELVKENKDCVNSVTAALEWFDLPTGHHVPRPHSPRTTLELSVMVITLRNSSERYFHTIVYLPSTDEWYRLPAHAQKHCLVTHVFSCQGKVFVVTGDLSRSQCYDPDLSRWSAAPWTKAAYQEFISYANENSLQDVLVVRNKICFIVEDEMGIVSLWTYNPDAKSMVPLFDWVKKLSFCAVVVDRSIYVVGGEPSDSLDLFNWTYLSECARFDTEGKWHEIAPLNEARKDAFGVSWNQKIFVAGGVAGLYILRSCEVFNTLTDEWSFIASLTVPRTMGNMVIVDETLYVVGGFLKKNVECYDDVRDKWNNKANIPVRKITQDKGGWSRRKGCSLRVFKGVLSNLQFIDQDK